MFREILWPRVAAGPGRKSGPHVSGKDDSTASIRSLEHPLTARKRRDLRCHNLKLSHLLPFAAPAANQQLNSGRGCRGQPSNLPDRPALNDRPRVAREVEREITTKPLKSLDSGPRKQVITGRPRQIGNHFRYQCVSSADEADISVHDVFQYQGSPAATAG
jgi:hypothetical protein